MGRSGEKWRKIRIFVVEIIISVRTMLFLGNIEAKIDVKGRAFLPASFRKMLQSEGFDRLVLRMDVYKDCLTLFPEPVWCAQLASLQAKLNRWNPQHQQILRKYMEDVEIVYLDANGRLLLPKKKLEAAGISTDIKFLGMGNYIEIWKNDGETFMEDEAFREALESIMNDTKESTP